MIAKYPSSAVSFPCLRQVVVRQEAHTKAFLVLMCLGFLGTKTVAQIESGTVIVVGYSKNKIIMAADSRTVDEGKAPLDNTCKITTLNDKLLFTGTGRNADITGGVLGWNVMEQAKQAFARISAQTPTPSESFTRELAMQWAIMTSQRISDHIRQTEYDTLKPGSHFVDGIFAGVGPDGNIQTGYIVIGSAGHPSTRRMGYSAVEEMKLSDTVSYRVFGGLTETFDEFRNVTSPRSKAEQKTTRKLSKTWAGKDADARMAIRLAELVIKYTDFPQYVHGPVDALEIDKGGTIRVIQRKANCVNN